MTNDEEPIGDNKELPVDVAQQDEEMIDYRLTENGIVNHEQVDKTAAFIKAHKELAVAILENFSIEDAELLLDKHYRGAYASEVDFAKSIVKERYSKVVPDHVIAFLDCRGFAHFLLSSEFCSVKVNEKTHVFSVEQS